ncbi:hypothetical protein [Actinophytocola sp.]|uniref:hypothetical protein n=1 Tax=Actinophytocola sp. TaxID=1872138 RepID=UPI002ED0F6D7
MVAPDPNPDPRTRTDEPADTERQGHRPDLWVVPPDGDVRPEGPPLPPSPEDMPVKPVAPLDIRVLQAIGNLWKERPQWSQPEPTAAEVWDYSTTGDWTTDDRALRRVFHALCVLVAFGLTFVPLWLIRVSRRKPGGFVMVVLVLFVISKVF